MPLSQSKLRSSSSPSVRVVEFAGFLSIYKYQLGGLDGTVSPYLHGRRGSFFVVNPGKVMPTFRKGASFAHSVGYLLGSVSLAGSSKDKPQSYLRAALRHMLEFHFSLVDGPQIGSRFSQAYFQALAASRFWKSPFRPGYYGRWIPGAFTNFPNVVKAYIKKSAPKLIDYRHRLSKNLQAWFLPRWFPSFAGVFDMLSSAPAIRETARMGVPNMGVGAIPVGRITVAEVTYPIVGHPSGLAGSVVFNGILQNYFKGLTCRLDELVVNAYEKALLGQDAFPAAFPFNQQKADAIFSAEDYARIARSKQTYEAYVAEQERLRAEREAERKKQELIEYFREEDRKLMETNPKAAKSKHRPTPVQRALVFPPLMYSSGKPLGPRQQELRRRQEVFEQLKKAGTYSPEELGDASTLSHGLYPDYFDKKGYLKPGRTLWNERPAPGQEDYVSKMFLRSFRGIRPDELVPTIDFGMHPPGSPKWDPSVYESYKKEAAKASKQNGKNRKRNRK